MIATQNPYEHRGRVRASRVAARPLPVQDRARLRRRAERVRDARSSAHAASRRTCSARSARCSASSASTRHATSWTRPRSPGGGRPLHGRDRAAQSREHPGRRARSELARHHPPRERLEGERAPEPGATRSASRTCARSRRTCCATASSSRTASRGRRAPHRARAGSGARARVLAAVAELRGPRQGVHPGLLRRHGKPRSYDRAAASSSARRREHPGEMHGGSPRSPRGRTTAPCPRRERRRVGDRRHRRRAHPRPPSPAAASRPCS